MPGTPTRTARHSTATSPDVKDEDTYWYLISGIEQNWFGFGKTTLYGEYGRHEVGAGLSAPWCYVVRQLRPRDRQRCGSWLGRLGWSGLLVLG